MNKQETISLPKYSTCRVCIFYLSDRCEPCINNGKESFFKPRANLLLEDLPLFPREEFEDGMPVKMRQIVIALYMEKIMEKLQEMTR